MNTLKLLRLGHKSISNNILSFIITALVVGGLFSFIIFEFFILKGMENNLLSAGLDATSGRIVTINNLCKTDYRENTENKCDAPENYDAIVEKASKGFGGNLLGAVIVYENESGKTLNVIPSKAVRYLKTQPVFSTQSTLIPRINALDQKLSNEFIDENIFNTIGTYPSSKTKVAEAGVDKYVDGFGSYFDSYVVMDVPEKIINYMAVNNYKMAYYWPVVEFDDFGKAQSYYKKYESDNYIINEMFAGNIKTKEQYEKLNRGKISVVIILFIASLIFTTILFNFSLEKEMKNIELYRTVGATKKDIRTIYMFKQLECMVLASIIAFTIGSIIALVTNNLHATQVTKAVNEVFGISYNSVSLIGFNIYHLVILLSIILIAPLCVLFSVRKLSLKKGILCRIFSK